MTALRRDAGGPKRVVTAEAGSPSVTPCQVTLAGAAEGDVDGAGGCNVAAANAMKAAAAAITDEVWRSRRSRDFS
jgi:hypothetical protein